MSKQIILDALASQFAVKQNELVQYETTVYQPSLDKLNESIGDWFGSVLFIRPHSAKFSDNTLEIVPTEDGKWPSAINIRKHYSYRDDENNYYDIDYRSSHNKVEMANIYYLTTLGKIAQNVNLIIENIENEWKPAYKAIHTPHYKLISELRTLESEINAVKQQIHSDNRETYKVPGFEHTVTSQLACKMNYDTNEYELKTVPYTIRLETGSGKWDYIWVNAYKVIGPSKYRKIAIQVKRNEGDERWEDIEVKGEYFDQFISEVYNWETRLREKRDEDETKRYNKFVEAKQTA